MDGLILAAGEGRRLGNEIGDVPKLFLEIDGRSLLGRHLDALAGICDRVTVVLGYGFVGEEASDTSLEWTTDRNRYDGEISVRDPDDGGGSPIAERKIRSLLGTDHDIDMDVVVVPHWAETENAESCRLGLAGCEGDVLILNGDIVYRDEALEYVLRRYRSDLRGDGTSAAAVQPGMQSAMTAFRWDADRMVTDYGEIEGHQVAGIFVLHRGDRERAGHFLRRYRHEWFPHVFAEIETKALPVPHDWVYEINTPDHLETARSGVREWADRPSVLDSTAADVKSSTSAIDD